MNAIDDLKIELYVARAANMYCRAGYTHAQAFTPQHRNPALSVLVSGWITTNVLLLSQASQAIVQSRRVPNRQITRRRQISTGMSATVYKSRPPGCKTGYPEVDSELPGKSCWLRGSMPRFLRLL